MQGCPDKELNAYSTVRGVTDKDDQWEVGLVPMYMT